MVLFLSATLCLESFKFENEKKKTLQKRKDKLLLG
jgi:hypothetical protein